MFFGFFHSSFQQVVEKPEKAVEKSFILSKKRGEIVIVGVLLWETLLKVLKTCLSMRLWKSFLVWKKQFLQADEHIVILHKSPFFKRQKWHHEPNFAKKCGKERN